MFTTAPRVGSTRSPLPEPYNGVLYSNPARLSKCRLAATRAQSSVSADSPNYRTGDLILAYMSALDAGDTDTTVAV